VRFQWDWINPWAKGEEQKEKLEKPPVSPLAYTYMARVIFITMAFVILVGIALVIVFHDRSAKFLFGMLAVLVFLATVVFGVALYVSLGFLQRTALAAKRKKEEEGKRVEPAEMWEMPKKKGE